MTIEYNPNRCCVTCGEPGYWWNDCPRCNNMAALHGFVAKIASLPADQQQSAVENALPDFTVERTDRSAGEAMTKAEFIEADSEEAK